MSRLPATTAGSHWEEVAAQPRPLPLVQLIAILALAASTLIAATAVSIGLARAAAPPCMTTVHGGGRIS